MNNNTITAIAKTIAAFKATHETGYIKLHCQSDMIGGKEIHFAATTSSDETKGFGVDLSIPCEDYENAVGELMKNLPMMFGFNSPVEKPAETTEPVAPVAPVPRRQRMKKEAVQSTTPTMPEFVPVQPVFSAQPATVVGDTPVPAPANEPAQVNTQQPATTVVDHEPVPAPRRRKPASAVYSADFLNQLSITPEAFAAPVSVETPNTSTVLDGQINLLDTVDTEPVTSASVPAEEPADMPEPSNAEALNAPSQPSAEASTIIPETDEEKLEKALCYTIPSNLGHGGMTLGELIEKLDRQTAERELRWFAYDYRGKDLKLKHAAERVLSIFAA